MVSKVWFLALVALVAAFETEDGVIVGTDSNFDDVIKSSDFVLVEFCKPRHLTFLFLTKKMLPGAAIANLLLPSTPKLQRSSLIWNRRSSWSRLMPQSTARAESVSRSRDTRPSSSSATEKL